MKTSWLMPLSAAAALAASQALGAAKSPTLDLEPAFTYGSQGYKKFSLSGEADWKGGKVEPYAWTDYDVDDFQWKIGAGAGLWKDVTPDVSVKGGLGFDVGHVYDTEGSAASFVFETGAERYFGAKALGAGYRLTAGTIGGPTAASSFDRSLHGRQASRAMGGPGRGAGRAAQVETETSLQSFTFHDLSAYASAPLGKTRLSLRLDLGLASDEGPDVTETLRLRIPLPPKSLWLTPAVTFEQGLSTSVYGSLGLLCRFGG